GAGEDLLHAEHLHALLARLVDVLDRALDLRVSDFLDALIDAGGQRGLDESAFHDSGHDCSPGWIDKRKAYYKRSHENACPLPPCFLRADLRPPRGRHS